MRRVAQTGSFLQLWPNQALRYESLELVVVYVNLVQVIGKVYGEYILLLISFFTLGLHYILV